MRERPLTKREQALVVGLADGTLRGRRRARAEARLAGLVDLEGALARQRRVAHALTVGPAPRTAVAFRASRGEERRRHVWSLAGAAAALATVLVAAMLMVPQAGSPTVAGAALDTLPAERAAPAQLADAPLLAGGVEGVSFPDWGAEFGWHAHGARDDLLDGRTTRTVFYEHMNHRIGYTIVSGEALPPPDGAQHVRRNGVDIALLRDGERDIAVFVRDGHTCVLSGEVLDRATLVTLAAWEADGEIEF